MMTVSVGPYACCGVSVGLKVLLRGPCGLRRISLHVFFVLFVYFYLFVCVFVFKWLIFIFWGVDRVSRVQFPSPVVAGSL